MIAYYFPPFGGVPVQRTLKFVKYLREYKWEPVVLTVRNGNDHFHPNDPSLLMKIPVAMEVVRTREINIIAKVIRSLRGKVPVKHSGSGDGQGKGIAAVIMKLRRLLYNSIWFPDEKNYWIPGAIATGLRILSDRDISAIYVSGYPWSSFLVGAFLSRLKGKPLILDFRDAWTLNPRKLWDNRLQRYWENMVLAQASKVIFATNLMREGYIERYPFMDKEKFVTITNGYDFDDFQYYKKKVTRIDKRFLITFTGTFNDNIPPLDTDQSPYYFLQGLSRMLKEKDISKNIRIRFVGDFGKNNKVLVKEMGLEDVVEFAGHVSHDKCIQYQTETDLLLLIIYTCEWSKSVLTGKLFEYIGAGKPILALVPDGEAKDLIIEDKLGIIVKPKDIDGIKNTILKFYTDWEQGKLKFEEHNSAVNKYEMRTLTKKLVDTIEEVTANYQENLNAI